MSAKLFSVTSWILFYRFFFNRLIYAEILDFALRTARILHERAYRRATIICISN